MKQTFSILVLVLTMVSLNASAGIFGGSGEQTNQQTNRQNVDQNQRQRQDQSQTARGGTGGSGGNASSDANAESYNDGNNTDIRYENDYKDTYREYVAPAYSPSLTSTGDCLGSASAGGSNSVMGFSIGKTYVDENCNARYDAILLHQMGRPLAAIKRLCSQPEMAKVLSECKSAVYNPAANDVVVTWD